MITTKPSPIVGIDLPPVPPQELLISRPRHPLPTRDVAQPFKTDMLTGRSRGLQFQNTYVYNGNALITTAGTYTLWIPATPTVRTRLKKLYIYFAENSLITNAGVTLVSLLDNNFQTGFVLPQYLANGISPQLPMTHSEDLGSDGYVSDAIGNILQINLSVTLNGGGLLVVAAGNDEIDYGPSA